MGDRPRRPTKRPAFLNNYSLAEDELKTKKSKKNGPKSRSTSSTGQAGASASAEPAADVAGPSRPSHTDMIDEIVEKKDFPQKFYIKMSHLDEEFSEVSLQQGRRHHLQQIPDALPSPAYEYPSFPKLSMDEYKDLMELTKGENPVIKHADHVQFYKALPH